MTKDININELLTLSTSFFGQLFYYEMPYIAFSRNDIDCK
jgi:hypothetical protein